jgi:predicted AAA+ superfamily ATPase
MFIRNIHDSLEKWCVKDDRKPLVLRGARQVGKTTAVHQFSKQFDQYIYVNLELPEDRKPFEEFKSIETLVQALFFLQNKTRTKEDRTLIFIDEIQEVPQALNILRYFYEQTPSIYVIAAGSLLETLFNQHMRFPVGRLEYLVLRPVSFTEFLQGIGETEALQALKTIPLPTYASDKLFDLYHLYAVIGGMPAVVWQYIKTKDLTSLRDVYESLIISYLEDVEKYAANASQVNIIRHVIRTSFAQASKRITFDGFGSSNYRSREIGEALRTLEKTMLLRLIYPNVGTRLPIIPDYKKSPKLQLLDTGMMNYFLGIQKDVFGTQDLNSIYQGGMLEHLVGQEMLSFQYGALRTLHFWVRDKAGSSAEVDFIYPFESDLIPIEVKSSASGHLKSLHLYMDVAPHNMAVRFYKGPLQISEVKTPKNKSFFLLNLPYFAAAQLDAYLAWFYEQVK